MTQPSTPVVRGYSVAELVSIRTTGGGAAWQLSLVQRGAVWDALKVRYLLDSLLAGYPIGSLLLCRVKRDGNVLVSEGGLRIRHEVDESVLQLLDGQQRINALAQLFAREEPDEQGRHRFLLRLDAERDMGDVVRRRTALDKTLGYIADTQGEPELAERWRWLDLSRLHAASVAGRVPELQALSAPGHGDLLRVAQQVDPDCSADAWDAATPDERERAEERLHRLVCAWRSPAIPVVELALEGPTDVLQVFNRVNRTGTGVSNDDMFFAAVRTQWNDAEEHVERVRAHSPLLSRIGTLRLAARLAASALDATDVLPLDIEKLGGDSGCKLIKKMKTLTAEDGALVRGIAAMSELALRKSGLGYGLRHVSGDTLDPLWAWAWAWAVERQLGTLTPDDLDPAWAFVVGTECFQYRQVFGDPFKRFAFAEAVKAGSEGEPFPLAAIVEHCRTEWPGLAKGRQRVQHIPAEPWTHPTDPTAPGPRRQLVNANAPLLLSIVQEVPYTLPAGHTLDVEHLYPQAHKAAMKWRGASNNNPSCHHPKAWDANRAGNLLWLDAGLNRAAQDDWPELKLQRYRGDAWTPALFLAADEEELLLRACQKIRGKDGKGWPGDPARDGVPPSEWMGDAMDCFARYVQRRELRVFDEVVRRYPGMLEMGGVESV